jgi:hypothetical protein
MANRRLFRLCQVLAVTSALTGAVLARALLAERFAFANLVDVHTSVEFDDVASREPPMDLHLPTVDQTFAQMVRQAVPAREPVVQLVPRIVAWAYAQLRTPGDAGTLESTNSPLFRWVPTDILAKAHDGGRFICDTYARFAAASGQALGLETRVIWLDGHVVTEFLDPSTGRWIATDPTVPAIVIDIDSGATMSFAEAAFRVRGGQPIDIQSVGDAWPEVDVPGSLAYLLKTLRRDLLVYVDGETTVQRVQPRLLVDWVVGRPRGVRLASERSTRRNAKRLGLCAAAVVFLAAVATGAWVRRRRA